MELTRIAVRALLAFIYLLFMTRIAGKRVIAQATPLDLVISLIIGDVIDDAIWAEVSTARFAVAVGTITFLQIVTMTGVHSSSRFAKLVTGLPTIIIRNGMLDTQALRSEQLNEKEVDLLLRHHQKDDRSDVRLATMELDHELSVLLEPEAEPAQRQDRTRLEEMDS